MKAKQVYEFIQKKSLKNTIKDDIGINKKLKDDKLKETIQWLKFLNKFKQIDITENDFFISSNNLEIVFIKSLDLSGIHDKNFYLLDNLVINSHYLEISDTSLAKLPNNLKIYGSLYMVNTNINELPNDLFVKNKIWVSAKYKYLFNPNNAKYGNIEFIDEY